MTSFDYAGMKKSCSSSSLVLSCNSSFSYDCSDKDFEQHWLTMPGFTGPCAADPIKK